MTEFLSENEKFILSVIKDDYDKRGTNPLTTMEPKIEVKIIEDVPALLQEKGYIQVKRTDLGTMEMVSIFLEDKFFEYFNL